MLALLGLFVLDPAVLCGLALWLNKGETKGFGTGILASLAIPIATMFFSVACAYLGFTFIPVAMIGFPLAIIFFYALAVFLVLWAVFDCPPLRALGGAAIYLVYKAIFLAVLSWLS